jgi:hypothetical protein
VPGHPGHGKLFASGLQLFDDILLCCAAQIMLGVTREFLLATLAAESVADIEVLITVCARSGDGHAADRVDHRSGSLWLVGFLHLMSRWRG